jgi:hypothetical protein
MKGGREGLDGRPRRPTPENAVGGRKKVEVKWVEEIHSIVFTMVVYRKDESGKEVPM